MLKPLQLMTDRVREYSDTDSVRFGELLYAGEFVTKLTTAAFIACIEDDRDNNRYRLIHGLVRASGLGDWSKALDETIIGPPSKLLATTLRQYSRVLTEKTAKGTWQYEAVWQLNDIMRELKKDYPQASEKLTLRSWFQLFSELRNKTRGHGALTPAKSSTLSPKLAATVTALVAKNPIFSIPWIFLHRNMSGRYTIIDLQSGTSPVAEIKSYLLTSDENFSDGVYIWLGKLHFIELLHTDLDCRDFFFPNGDFRNDSYELHSLITDNRQKGDGTPYLAAPIGRPASETEGHGELEIVGQVFTNIPPTPSATYITRPTLEKEVYEAFMDDRHPIVTLKGRGGIGKTSLTLAVLRKISETQRFSVIVWFSARDIDLLTSGAKVVKPRVMSESDVAELYCKLVGVSESELKKMSQALLAEHFKDSPLGSTLFVFDNFETLKNPIDVFKYIDNNIKLPNKAVITTRFRDFKADFPIEVLGMEYAEAIALISRTSAQLKIEPLIDKTEKEAIFEQSNGHPYVIKIILGTIADQGKYVKPSNIIAKKDEILEALFERTFANLSPIAARIFLMLSTWRSLVPQAAVEAVLLRHGNDDCDPDSGIDELLRMSLIERTVADDGADFLEVPLTAALFGKKKLTVSPIRLIVEGDLKVLQEIGPTSKSGLKEGIGPRIDLFIRRIARKLGEGTGQLAELRPMLEFLARRHPPSWLQLATLEQERGEPRWQKNAAEYVRRYLETEPSITQAQAAWQKLFSIYRIEGDAIAGCAAFLKISEYSQPPYSEISFMANWLNNDVNWKKLLDVSERKTVLLPLLRMMEDRLKEATATDRSRLAWLHLLCGDDKLAMDLAQEGLRQEPDNIHCRKIVEKLSASRGARRPSRW